MHVHLMFVSGNEQSKLKYQIKLKWKLNIKLKSYCALHYFLVYKIVPHIIICYYVWKEEIQRDLHTTVAIWVPLDTNPMAIGRK